MKYIKKFNESIEEDIKGLVHNLLSDYLRKTNSYITYYSLKGDDNLITFSISSKHGGFDSHGNFSPGGQVWLMDWKDDLIQFFNYVKAQYSIDDNIVIRSKYGAFIYKISGLDELSEDFTYLDIDFFLTRNKKPVLLL